MIALINVRRSKCGQHLLVATQNKKEMGKGRSSALDCLAFLELVYPMLLLLLVVMMMIVMLML